MATIPAGYLDLLEQKKAFAHLATIMPNVGKPTGRTAAAAAASEPKLTGPGLAQPLESRVRS
jgi:hypothetical protein